MKFFRHKKVLLTLNSYSQSGDGALPGYCHFTLLYTRWPHPVPELDSEKKASQNDFHAL
jgi:hypothetical protein